MVFTGMRAFKWEVIEERELWFIFKDARQRMLEATPFWWPHGQDVWTRLADQASTRKDDVIIDHLGIIWPKGELH